MILLNKPKFLTSLQTIQKYQKVNPYYKNSKLGYAGTLDPMATGLLVVLVDAENKERSKFISLTKTYEFCMLIGISTDTGDLLGIPNNFGANISKTPLEKILKKYIGQYTQKFPDFSSKIINGERMYKLARENRLDNKIIPKFKREIISLELIKSELISSKNLLKNVNEACDKVSGDFRQTQILNKWNELSLQDNYQIFKVSAKVSSGTYIRQLVVDITKDLNTVGLAYTIDRTYIGEYDKKNAVKL